MPLNAYLVNFVFVVLNNLALLGEGKTYAAILCAGFSRLSLVSALYCVQKTIFLN